MVDIHEKDDGGGLWKTVNEFVTDPKLHANTLIRGSELRELG